MRKPDQIVHLTLDPRLCFAEGQKDLRDGLSVVERTGRYLWVASDETSALERLVTEDGVHYAGHRQFPLAPYLDLPEGPEGEVDIEGLEYRDQYLWLVGSHSLKRRKPKPDKRDAKNIGRLAEVEAEANRYLLARIPLVEIDGELQLVRSCPDPSRPGETLTAAQLPISGNGNALTRALREDAHLAPFLGIPGKDNGFDVEGIAAAGGKVFLGLRGPVLRGWSCVLELDVDAPGGDRLALREIGPKGEPYRKHFLQIGGLGIREIVADGDDLLMLSGPTMDLDGPVDVWRWRDAAHHDEQNLVWPDEMERLLEVPYGTGPTAGKDHPEGMAVLREEGGRRSLLVVYDAPADERKVGESTILADRFEL